MSDIKQDVKAFVKVFIQVFVSSVVKESTKKMIKSLSQRKRKLLEAKSKKMSDDQIVQYFDKSSFFKKTLENTIKSVCDLPSSKGTGSLIGKLESIYETTSYFNNPINTLILPASKSIVAVAASTVVLTTAAVTIMYLAPSANFASNVTEGYAPLSVQFTDLSQNATSWNWNFGDGDYSSEKDPTHTYYAAGDYTVKLKASNENSTDSKSAKIKVLQPVLPVANFRSSTIQGVVPLSVQFTDISQNSLSRIWEFGDGAISTEQNPTHIYSTAGNYIVKLTATNVNGIDVESVLITVLEQTVLPIANFSINTTEGDAPLSVQFTDISQNSLSRSWEFGDGAISTEQNPTHIYYAAGNYIVKLIATNVNGTSLKSAIINVTPLIPEEYRVFEKSIPVISWSSPANITYGTALNSTQLNAKASVLGTFVYSPPSGTVLSAGTHSLHVDFTPDDTANYTNASKTSEITVLNDAADLTISSFSINPKAPNTADQITFTAVVKNQGNSASGASTVSIKVGGEPQSNAPRYYIPALKPGDKYTVTRTLNLNVAQNYIAIATADPDGYVVEDKESNNQATVTFTVDKAVRDLIIRNFSINPISPTTADQITFTAVVMNQGNAASGATKASIKVGGESQASAPRYDIPSLDPGAKYTVTRTLGGFRPIAFMANATADPEDNVAESNETNNLASITFSVTETFPDLIISSFSINPASPTTADQITFTAVVKNQGNAASSASTVSIRVGGEYPPSAPRYNVPALAPGATHTVTRTLNLNVTQNYIAEATADPEESIIESNESNNQATVTFTVKTVIDSNVSNISI